MRDVMLHLLLMIAVPVLIADTFLLMVLVKLADKLLTQGVKIMATQAEGAADLVKLKEQLAKANGEIQTKIQELTDAAANSSNLSPELSAAIDALKPAAQALDDIVPDAVP